MGGAGAPAPAGSTAGAGGAGGVTSGASGTGGAGMAGMAGASAGATAGTGGAAGTGGGGGAGGADPDAGVSDGGGEDAGPSCNITIPPSTNCADPLAPGDERTCMLGSREYIVHAGKTMNPCEPVALVIDAHGATETAPQQLGKEAFCSSSSLCWNGLGSGWAAESDTPGGGFIVVFPQGNNNMWSASDADFMLDIVEEMKTLADIDPNKIYMTGISNGAFLTYQTGCPHSDVFRGMSPNAGGTTCSRITRPIPSITFDAEPDFAYAGAVAATEALAELNGCAAEAKPWLTIDGSGSYTEAVCRTAKQDTMATLVPCSEVTSAEVEPTVCKIWEECDEDVKVAFCEVAPNTEHGASNAAVDAHIIYENNTILNTPSMAWRFFKMFW
jgi:poly(3-hydroxybutyrate) depolymerase